MKRWSLTQKAIGGAAIALLAVFIYALWTSGIAPPEVSECDAEFNGGLAVGIALKNPGLGFALGTSRRTACEAR